MQLSCVVFVVTLCTVLDGSLADSVGSYFFSIEENNIPGAYLGKVEAQSENSAELRYDVDKPDVATIDPKTGVMRASQVFDYERESKYEVIVTAHNPNVTQGAAQMLVQISVIDTNEHPPVIEVNYLTSTGKGEIRENSFPGTFVAYLSVTDKDSEPNSDVVCTLKGEDLDLIRLYGKTVYKIVTRRLFDREHTPSYSTRMECNDQGAPPLSSTVTIDLTITDLNDNMPQFRKRVYTTAVMEGQAPGTQVLQVAAIDNDSGRNAEVTYSLRETSGAFTIDEQSGMISTKVILDRETRDVHSFMVMAKDNGEPQRTATSQVKVTVGDNRPLFIMREYHAAVLEGAPPGTVVIQVAASDRDSGQNGELSYSLVDGAGVVAIDSKSGRISTIAELDHEKQAKYNVTAQATDQGQPPLKGTVTIYLTVQAEQ